jgi:hypothetical protein
VSISAQEDTPPALALREEVVARGVAEYRLGYDNGWSTVDLLDANKAVVARVATRRDIGGAQFVSFERYAEHFTIVFDAAKGISELREPGGFSYTMKFDARTRRFEPEPGAAERFAAHYDAIALAVESIDDLRSRRDALIQEGAKRRLRPGTRLMIQDPGGSLCPFMANCVFYMWNGSWWDMNSYWDWDTSGGGAGPNPLACNGYTVVGESFGDLMRSQACHYATNDANVKCWNQYCIGCCRLQPCDAICTTGDYLCVMATVVGQACGRP